MGVKNLPPIVAELTRHGRAPETPVAARALGDHAGAGYRERHAGRHRRAGRAGRTQGARPSSWWAKSSACANACNGSRTGRLFGKRIVVTRSRDQASDLVRALSDLGAECLECPTIQVVAAGRCRPARPGDRGAAAFDWIVFTSVNGVSRFFKRLFACGKDVRALGHLRTAAIGPVTAERLKCFGLSSDLVPETFQAEAVVAAFSQGADPRQKNSAAPGPGSPAGAAGRAGRHGGERARGRRVQNRTSLPRTLGQLVARLEERPIDLITFTSSSTVKNFKALHPGRPFCRTDERGPNGLHRPDHGRHRTPTGIRGPDRGARAIRSRGWSNRF